MDRSVTKVIFLFCGEAILFTVITGVAIGIFGYIRHWNSTISYSNAFFVAGCLFIVGGGMSRLAAGGEWNTFLLFSGESFRDMSASERANFIVEASSSMRFVIVCLLTGVLLILISAIVGYAL